jgi:hypothetical protein
MEEDDGERSLVKLIDMSEYVQYNKGCSQMMAQIPMDQTWPARDYTGGNFFSVGSEVCQQVKKTAKKS